MISRWQDEYNSRNPERWIQVIAVDLVRKDLGRIQLRHIWPETVQQRKSWWQAKYYRLPTGDDGGACCDDPRELSTPGFTARMYVTLPPSSGRPRTPGRFAWISTLAPFMKFIHSSIRIQSGGRSPGYHPGDGISSNLVEIQYTGKPDFSNFLSKTNWVRMQKFAQKIKLVLLTNVFFSWKNLREFRHQQILRNILSKFPFFLLKHSPNFQKIELSREKFRHFLINLFSEFSRVSRVFYKHFAKWCYILFKTWSYILLPTNVTSDFPGENTHTHTY